MEKRKRTVGEQLTHRIHTRIRREKYEELTALMGRSLAIHSLSELLRHMLDERPILVQTVDRTAEKVMAEMSAIRTELHAIGVNINQVTRSFHIADEPEARLMKVLELTRLYQQTDAKMTELFSIIAKLSGSWLPG